MGLRLVLYVLAGTTVLVGCLERKTGNPDANEMVDLGPPADSLALDRQAGDSDMLRQDVAPPSDRDASLVVPGLDGATPPGGGGGTGPGGATGSGAISGSFGGATGSGGFLGSAAGAAGTGAAAGTGGITTATDPTARGGAGAPGGVSGTGGVTGNGGTVGADGGIGTGGIDATAGTTCQPRPRDCTSSLDNDCNGKPDNQESTYCVCVVGESRACLEHPGYDGKGICKAGRQTCAASSDKQTSAWADDCTGAVAPATEVCDAVGLDEDCDGQANDGCECVNGSSVPCECGPATICVNGKKGTCSETKVTMYLDSDGDDYGNPARPGLVCRGAPGYVSNADDCDDTTSGASFHPGVSVCADDYATRKWCEAGGGGVSKTELCTYGCAGGQCHPSSHGTIGLPGYVSCTPDHSPQCDATTGCTWSNGSCGGGIQCDGPSDCPAGQKCFYYLERGLGGASCASAKPEAWYLEVCDPLAGTCNCQLESGLGAFYTCQ